MGISELELFFLIFGIIAFLSVMASIFIPSETLTDELYTESQEPVDSPGFIKAISSLVDSTISRAGEIEILNNAEEFLGRFLEDARLSEKSINFTNYIWKPGKFSDSIFDVLIAKQKEGVEVRLLLDTVGSKFLPKKQADELRSFGGKVKYFRTPRFGRLSRFHKRNHRRAIVVDGRIGYTGGVAIDDKWLGSEKNENKWHDSMVRITGPAASRTQSVFAQLWTSTTGEILAGEKFYPPQNESESGIISLNVLSSPAEDTQPLPRFFWYSIQAARKYIHITNPYFLPPPPVLKALAEARKRGVEIKIILPSSLTDAKFVRWASQGNYEILLKEGVRIFEYSKSRLHSKHFIVDGIWSIVGSANMDNRSMSLNQENVFAVLDGSFGKKMEEIFSEDLKNSEEIRPEEWRSRNLFRRVREWASKILEKQY